MVGKFLSYFLLLAIIAKLCVEARPAEEEEKVEEEDEEDFKARCLLALALLPALAGRFGVNQAPPQQFLNPPPQTIEYILEPEIIYEPIYTETEYIYVDLYQRPNGELFYYSYTPDGQLVEVIYPVDLIRKTEFTRTVKDSRDTITAKVLRSDVVEYETEKIRRETIKEVSQPQFQTVKQSVHPVPQPQYQVVQRVPQQVQVQSQPIQRPAARQGTMVVGTAKRGQVPAGATIVGVRRN